MTQFLLCRALRFLCVLCALCVGCSALDRDAFTFVNYDLQVRLSPSSHMFSAEGKITLRNDSDAPQKNATLQISSSLDWQSIRVNGSDLVYVNQPYQSDVDHTGVVNEAVLTFPTAIAPKQTLEIEVSYAGPIVADSTRFTRIGMPQKVALESDWDQINADFTAVRGVGYVCWYPVSMEPANLSEGNRFFDTIGDWKQRNASATMKLVLEVEGAKALITNGKLVSATAHAALDPDQPPIRKNEYSFAPIGLYPPSFSAGDFTALDRPAITVSYLPDHQGAAEEFALSAEKVLPFISDWLGKPHEKVSVIELPDPNAIPFDSGTTVFTSLRTSDTNRVELQIAHQIAHACLPAGITRPWISEGLSQFAQALVRERQEGRKSALAWMNAYIPALVSAEEQSLAPEPKSAQDQTTTPDQKSAPASAQQPQGSPRVSAQSLIGAADPAYYTIKSMFVWWMLRDMVGDQALGRAIRAYDPVKDKEPSTMQRLIEAQFKRDLERFFDDWVYRDRGLPDFKIETAFVRPMMSQNGTTSAGFSVTLTIENLGNAGAEVPVVVHTSGGDISSRVMVEAKSKAVQRIQVPAQPTTATVNDGSVPEGVITNNTFSFSKSQ